MQDTLKFRLKVEAVENGQWLIVAMIVLGTLVGLDTLLDHSRAPISVLAVVVSALGVGSIVNSFLNLMLADVRERLYADTEVEQDA